MSSTASRASTADGREGSGSGNCDSVVLNSHLLAELVAHGRVTNLYLTETTKNTKISGTQTSRVVTPLGRPCSL
jgi:hypothetical protein